ncbi:MAG: hypothetical protein IPP88_21450 [Betaproteobacteria bacterium]|nr:hypothetical protein [Betaproteobacteria bacterium]
MAIALRGVFQEWPRRKGCAELQRRAPFQLAETRLGGRSIDFVQCVLHDVSNPLPMGISGLRGRSLPPVFLRELCIFLRDFLGAGQFPATISPYSLCPYFLPPFSPWRSSRQRLPSFSFFSLPLPWAPAS